ncbi:MAG: hypothetical protein COA90_01660 [Gammaproteobacteria bacterium]|nr:MAG: hypothetical protein COA90_01660 [Gammaproteobacteria bacterium]
MQNKDILLLTTDETANTVITDLDSWGFGYELSSSLNQAFSLLMQAAVYKKHYQILLVEQASIEDIGPEAFSKMINKEHELNGLSLVLLNSAESKTYQPFYTAVLENLNNTDLLFKSIQMAQGLNSEAKQILALSEHFSAHSHSSSHSLSILIADDQHVNLKILERILFHAGHHCLLAKTGQQALDILIREGESLDIVILDMHMPDRSGLEIVQAMKYIHPDKHLPTIMLTADMTLEAKSKCLNEGVNVFLTKPIDAKVLLENISALALSKGKKIQHDDSLWIDKQAINSLSQLANGQRFLNQVIDTFKTSSARNMATIKEAVHNDYYHYCESLHSLKGAATELGASKLAALCFQAEQFKEYEIGSRALITFVDDIEAALKNTISSLDDNFLEPGANKNYS